MPCLFFRDIIDVGDRIPFQPPCLASYAIAVAARGIMVFGVLVLLPSQDR